jgi:hypothetical protein
MAGLALSAPAPFPGAPSVAQVQQAIRRLQDLSMTQTPLLAKQWLACQPRDPMPRSMAEALRGLCLLIDTPMPPGLMVMFDRVDQSG